MTLSIIPLLIKVTRTDRHAALAMTLSQKRLRGMDGGKAAIHPPIL